MRRLETELNASQKFGQLHAHVWRLERHAYEMYRQIMKLLHFQL